MVKTEIRSDNGRRRRRSSSAKRPWQFSLLFLFVLTMICAVLLNAAKSFPLETLIVAIVLTISGIGIVLYIGELVVIGWVVDFFSEFGMPKTRAGSVSLEFEQVGEIMVVTLHDNIASAHQCQSVQKQLKRLLDEHHHDFVLDFLHVGNVSRRFRGVLLGFVKAARKEVGNRGKPYRPLVLPQGDAFRVFENRASAVEDMSKHDGHGWVVLCSVPPGIRAVSEQA
jgi:hypothetical protein